MGINNDMKIIILSEFGRPWTMNSIPESLQKIDMPYTIGIIEPGCEYDILHKVNYGLIGEVDIILVLRCDHAFDIFGRFDTADFTNDELIKSLGACGKPVLFVTHDESIDYGFPSLYYPIYTTATYVETKTQTIPTFEPKKYLFSCLSNRPRDFRIVNYILFNKSTYFDASLLTLCTCNKTHLGIGDLQVWGQTYIDTYLNEILPVLPITSLDVEYYFTTGDEYMPEGTKLTQSPMRYNNCAYFDSYVNVVTETNYHKTPFISEKTIKPILACQFFVVISSKHTIKLLRDLGFDTYDDIINHDMYDNSDNENRVHDVHKLLNIIQWHNWIELYNNTTERRQANRDKLVSLQFETEFLNKIEQHIRNYYGT